jgi:hypothetical protein
MTSASRKFYSNMFGQIAMFSLTGFSASMVMALLGGFEQIVQRQMIERGSRRQSGSAFLSFRGIAPRLKAKNSRANGLP